MYTIQEVGKDQWLVHYETINERYTKEFKSKKEAEAYIKNR